MAHADSTADTDPTDLTHELQTGDTIPAGFHDAVTPQAFPVADPYVEHSWPHSIWLALWSDGTVDCYEDEACGNIFEFWSEKSPMKLSEGEKCWPVAKREIVL